MNEDKKVILSDMLSRLQDYQHYENPHQAFEIILYGWAKQTHHGTQWLSAVKRRDWLSYAHAVSFAKYCLQKGKWRILLPRNVTQK